MLVAISRVYIGIHYAGDVAGGFLTAFVAAAIISLVYAEGSALDRRVTSLL